MKQYRKQVAGLVGTTMIGAAGSIGLSSIGGNVATQGNQGIQNAFSFAPAMGSMIGAGMLMGTVNKTFKQKRRK